MPIYQLGDKKPVIPDSCYISPEAVIIGEVRLGENVSIMSGAVLRADNEPIVIGDGSNVQENCVLHTDPGAPLNIGAGVTIGHCVMLHGCTVGDGALIGIGSIVLNGAKIGRNCLVGAGALITEGKEFPDNTMILGAPAKVVRELSPEQAARMGMGALGYVRNWQRFKAGLSAL
jgi:carbonic anhydrase/acetyltransferase-like protein (isoleucine patch superfamily)